MEGVGGERRGLEHAELLAPRVAIVEPAAEKRVGRRGAACQRAGAVKGLGHDVKAAARPQAVRPRSGRRLRRSRRPGTDSIQRLLHNQINPVGARRIRVGARLKCACDFASKLSPLRVRLCPHQRRARRLELCHTRLRIRVAARDDQHRLLQRRVRPIVHDLHQLRALHDAACRLHVLVNHENVEGTRLTAAIAAATAAAAAATVAAAAAIALALAGVHHLQRFLRRARALDMRRRAVKLLQAHGD